MRKQKVVKFEQLQKVLSEITIQLYRESGYRASTRYFQFLRSAIPVTSTLIMLGKSIPPVRLTKILAMSFFRGFVWGEIKKLALYMPSKFGDLHSALAGKITEFQQDRDREQWRLKPTQATPPASGLNLLCSDALQLRGSAN